MLGRKFLFGCFVATLLVSLPQVAEPFSWGDVTNTAHDVWEDTTGAIEDALPSNVVTSLLNSNIVSYLSQAFETSVASAITSIATGITGGVKAVETFFQGAGSYGPTISSGIQIVPYLDLSVVENALSTFQNGSWDKLEKGVKYVLYTFPSAIQSKLSTGINYFSSLLTASLLPFPLNVLESQDMEDISSCMKDGVLSEFKDWAEKIGTLYLNLGGKLDITPLFNTESIKKEWDASTQCLVNKAMDIYSRKSSSSVDATLQKAYDYFSSGDDLVIVETIDFTACTLVCGSVSIGIAASALEQKAQVYWTAALRINFSPTAGAAFGSHVGFYLNFAKVAGYGTPAESNSIAFEKGNLPKSLSFITNASVDFDMASGAEGAFLGFKIESDDVNLHFGMNGAFRMSYSYGLSWWLNTTSELKELWGLVSNIKSVDAAKKKVSNAFNDIIKNMESGAFQVLTSIDTSNTVTNNFLSLSCPSDEQKSGNASSLDLGYIEIIDVLYGNIKNGTYCNATGAFSAVWDKCAYANSCSVKADIATLGQSICPQAVSSVLSVLYTCRGAVSAWDLKCFGARFADIIDKKLYQDFRNPILNDADWINRDNAMGKCAAIAKQDNREGFAMYDGGICISFKDLFRDGEYNKYNATSNSDCDTKGRGSAARWNLYAFQTAEIALQDLGCYDASMMLSALSGYNFQNFEGLHYLLQDNHTTRTSAVSKCAQVAYENDYPGFALINNGECIVSKAFKNVTLIQSGLTMQNRSYCSNGQGTDKSYSVYQFPYLTKHSGQQGLTRAEIIAIATFASFFGAVITLFSVLCVRKYKGEKEPCTKWRQDWLSRTACARCQRCRYCLPLGLTPFCCSRWLECKCQCCKSQCGKNQCKSQCKSPCKNLCKTSCKTSCKNPCKNCCSCRDIPKRLTGNPQTTTSAKTPSKPASATTTTTVTTAAPTKVKVPPKVILR